MAFSRRCILCVTQLFSLADYVFDEAIGNDQVAQTDETSRSVRSIRVPLLHLFPFQITAKPIFRHMMMCGIEWSKLHV